MFFGKEMSLGNNRKRLGREARLFGSKTTFFEMRSGPSTEETWKYEFDLFPQSS